MEIFEILDKKDDYFYNIANNFNFILVKDIKRKHFDGFFYDLTMEDSNNYVAGLSNMIFIHNTHVAGIIAALDNDIGVVGVAPDAHIYSVRILDYAATGTASDITAGLEWCLNNNMQIVNMSLGSCEDSISVERAIDALYDHGILLIAAAGNDGNGMGTGDSIDNPARYNSVVAVGATDINDNRASFSGTGPKLEISAPGKDIHSLLPGNKYGILSGTSMASPHVAGVAALIMSADPGMSNVQTRIRLQITTQNISKSPGSFETKSWFGYGLVDAVKAVPI
jgi:subtilisin family serine protease